MSPKSLFVGGYCSPDPQTSKTVVRNLSVVEGKRDVFELLFLS